MAPSFVVTEPSPAASWAFRHLGKAAQNRQSSRDLRQRVRATLREVSDTGQRLRASLAQSAVVLAEIRRGLDGDGVVGLAGAGLIEVDGGVRIDLHTLQVIDTSGRRQVLTPTEWRLLQALLRARGQVVSRSELAEQLWGPALDRSAEIEVYVSRLRRKMGGRRDGVVETIRGQGYRLRLSAITPRNGAGRPSRAAPPA